jgi:hypothetical protein
MADMDFRFKPGFGEDPRIGLGTGLSLHLGSLITLMGESMNSLVLFSDSRPSHLETWTAAGVRLRWPWHRNLSFDLGVSYLGDNRGNNRLIDIDVFNNMEWYQKIYFDMAYSGVF